MTLRNGRPAGLENTNGKRSGKAACNHKKENRRSGSGDSWFEPKRGNSKRDAAFRRVALRLSTKVCEYVSEYNRP